MSTFFITSYEKEIEDLKKLLDKELFNTKLLSEQVMDLQRQNANLANANDTLIKSNQSYERKWQKVYSSLQFYRDFYQKYSDQVSKHHTNRSWGHSILSSTKIPELQTINETYELDQHLYSYKFSNSKLREDRNQNLPYNNFINAEAEGEGNAQALSDRCFDSIHKKPRIAGRVGNLLEATVQDHKIYLLNLAKEIYLNPSIEKYLTEASGNKEITESSHAPSAKHRSLSSPLDYKSGLFEDMMGLAQKYQDPRKTTLTTAKKKRKVNQNTDFQIGASPLVNLDFSIIKDAYPNKARVNQNEKTPQNQQQNEDDMNFTVLMDDKGKKLMEMSFISQNELFH